MGLHFSYLTVRSTLLYITIDARNLLSRKISMKGHACRINPIFWSIHIFGSSIFSPVIKILTFSLWLDLALTFSVITLIMGNVIYWKSCTQRQRSIINQDRRADISTSHHWMQNESTTWNLSQKHPHTTPHTWNLVPRSLSLERRMWALNTSALNNHKSCSWSRDKPNPTYNHTTIVYYNNNAWEFESVILITPDEPCMTFQGDMEYPLSIALFSLYLHVIKNNVCASAKKW